VPKVVGGRGEGKNRLLAALTCKEGCEMAWECLKKMARREWEGKNRLLAALTCDVRKAVVKIRPLRPPVTWAA